MRTNRYLWIMIAGIALVLLAACAGTNPTVPAGISETLEGVGDDVPAAAAAALTWLSQETGVDVADIQIVSAEPMEWSDSCLGLGGPAESCAAAVTPGYEVVLSAAGQNYTLRTDQTGEVIRMEEPAGGTSSGGASSLDGTSWTLVSFGAPGSETPVIEGSEVNLSFAGGQVSGNAGCNSFNGPYQVENGSLTFGPLASTLRACADENITQQEMAYLEAFQTASRFEVSGDQLMIWYNNEGSVLNFTQGANSGG